MTISHDIRPLTDERPAVECDECGRTVYEGDWDFVSEGDREVALCCDCIEWLSGVECHDCHQTIADRSEARPLTVLLHGHGTTRHICLACHDRRHEAQKGDL